MNLKDKLPMLFVLGIVVLGAFAMVSRNTTWFDNANSMSVNVPTLTGAAAAGQQAFETNCQQCHGTNGSGSENGPPLIHDIYNPGHHNDDSFYRAMQNGTPQHHWRFGDMPAQKQVTAVEARNIVRYVRALQAANGIKYRPHRM